MIWDLSHIFNLIRFIVSIFLAIFTYLSYRKTKLRSILILFITFIGSSIVASGSFLMLFFEPDIGIFFWRLSSFGATFGLSAFLYLFIELDVIKNKTFIQFLKIFILAYFILFGFFYVIYPAELVTSPTGENDWRPHIIGLITAGLATIVSFLLSIYFIIFGIRVKKEKPLLFGLGSAIFLSGMFFIALADVDRYVFYKMLIIIGLVLMFISKVIL